MSKAEKRTFKLYHQLYKGKNKGFLKLFDFLNKQEKIDATKVQRFFIREHIDNTNLCIAYLYDKLIHSLSEEACKSFTELYGNSLLNSLHTFAVFFYAGLYDLAYEDLCRVEQKALEENHLIEAVYTKELKWRLIHQAEIQFTLSPHELIDDQISMTEALLLEYKLFKMNYTIRHTDKEQIDYDRSLKALLSYEEKADKLSSLAKIHLYQSLYSLYYYHDEYEQAIFYIKKNIHLWENMGSERLEMDAYLMTWNNLLMAYIRSEAKEQGEYSYKRYLELPQTFPLLFDKLSTNLQVPYHFTGHCYRTVSAIRYRTYEQIKPVEKDIEMHLEKFAGHLSWLNIIGTTLTHIIQGNIILKKYSRADFWLNKLEDLPVKHPQILAESQLLELMILYDEQSNILLKSKLMRLKRKWKKEKPAFPSVVFVLGLINKVMLKRSQDKLSEIWTHAYQDALKMEAENKTIILVSRWIEQKINS